jgi:hypothetical protein
MVNVADKAKVVWHGKWIWPDIFISKMAGSPDRPPEFQHLKREEWNKFILARRSFELKYIPAKAILNITADSRYKLFINGKYVGRGINRCEAYYWYYNSYDVTPFLKEGKNVIAIHARFYGMELAYYTPPELPGRNKENCGKGGLLFELGIYETDQPNPSYWIGSDSETKVIQNVAERSDMPLKNDAMGFLEEIDSRMMPQDWNEAAYDDSKWKSPVILDYPVKILLEDENAPLHEELVFPEKILHLGEVQDLCNDEDFDEEDMKGMDFNIQYKMEQDPEPLQSISVINPENLITNNGVCEITSFDPSKACFILLKYAKEVVGYPRLVVEGPAGTIIDIISFEKLSGKKIGLGFLGHKRGARLILRGGKQFFEQWDWEGYLYSQIMIRNITGPVKIYQCASNFTHMQTPRKGYFECSDPLLTKLWDACAHTLRCCAIDGYLDCPSREQRAYLGDAYPEAMVAFACFGEPRLTKKIIYDTAFGQRKDGLTLSFHPGDAQLQCHIIPDYCLYWIQIAYEYWRYTGDEKALRDLYPHFVRALEWFLVFLDSELHLIRPELPYWIFIDWSFPHTKPGYNAIINTQLMDCFRIVAEIGNQLGDHDNAQIFSSKMTVMKNQIANIFWDPTEGCYKDFYLDGKLYGVSQHTNSYLILKGIANPDSIQKIMERIFSPKMIDLTIQQIQELQQHKKTSRSLYDTYSSQVLVAQPFFMHHVNRMLASQGRFDIILQYLREGWGPMVNNGATGTIWETWNDEGSECHAWCATPAFDLSSEWLGIKPTQPGFSHLQIKPTFTGLDWVKGMFSTVIGDIIVEWKKEVNKVSISIIVPAGREDVTFKVPELEGKEPIEVISVEKMIDKLVFALKPGKNEFIIHF